MYEFDKALLASIFKSLTDMCFECGVDETHGKIWIFDTIKAETINSAVFMIWVGVSNYTVYWLSPFRVKDENEIIWKAVHKYFDELNLRRDDEFGAFEILPWGSIRFRHKVNCGDGIPDEKTVRDCLYCVMFSVAKWSEGLVAIICRGETDVKAVFDKYYPIVLDEQTQWLLDHFDLPDEERVKIFVEKFGPDEGTDTNLPGS